MDVLTDEEKALTVSVMRDWHAIMSGKIAGVVAKLAPPAPPPPAEETPTDGEPVKPGVLV